MEPPLPDASYREPAEAAAALDPLDTALAREIYETQLEGERRAEAERQKRDEKERRSRVRRRRRFRVEADEPYSWLVVRQERGEQLTELLLIVVMAAMSLGGPGLMVGLGLEHSDPWLWGAGLVTGACLVPMTAWFLRSVWPYMLCDALRLRVTPHHFEAIWAGHRIVGERQELALDAGDERVRITTAHHGFRFDELHGEDVDVAISFFRANDLKID